MTKKELDGYKKKLLKIQGEHFDEIKKIEGICLHDSPRNASGDLSTSPLHIADTAADSYEQEKNIGLVTKANRIFYEISNALFRIDHENYGICEECGKEISRKRLNAMPYVRVCIDCKRTSEKE